MLYEKSKLKNISFPLGGIGSGSVGLAGNGALVDWEIFNRPNKGGINGYSNFALKLDYQGKTLAKVLQGDAITPLTGTDNNFGLGPRTQTMAGYPHFKNAVFEGNFPIASLTLSEDGFPVVARLKAFNPLIPHDDYDSSLPAAFFEWEIENLTDDELPCAIAFSLLNPSDKSLNAPFVSNEKNGLYLFDAEHEKDDPSYKDLSIITDAPDSAVQCFWYRGTWMDSPTVFWKNFVQDYRIRPRVYDNVGSRDEGSLVAYFTLPPKARNSVKFVLTWNVPTQYNYWNEIKDENGKDLTWKNYYATLFENSKASASYAIEHFLELLEKTEDFTNTLYQSSLPAELVEAISANLSVLKTATVLRLEDGSLWAWEGVYRQKGSCEGSCQHVWNYAYTLAFLFPKLERSLRENTMKYGLYPDGSTSFRLSLPIGRERDKGRACVDGQMGEVIKCYREWKISGDDEWLKSHAEKIFKMLEFAWSDDNFDAWDKDADGILEGRQHHTLDMELFGPSSWLEGFYLLALDCGAKIADFVGDEKRAAFYRKLYANGKKWTNERLFNGKYFIQQIDIKDKSLLEKFENAEQKYWNNETGEIKYQIANGCIIDQMLADWHASIIGCEPVFDENKKQIALDNLYKNNFKENMRDVTNMWRNFAVDDERGTIICSYPDGVAVPTIPIPYCEECMTGFEYALAGLMLSNGKENECLNMVSAVRDRYDGEKRNPWNEIECGSNYARSMASFALLPIYSGFQFDMSKKHVGFFPLRDSGSFLWSVKNSWGKVKISENGVIFEVFGEPITLVSFGIKRANRAAELSIDGKPVDFKTFSDKIAFRQTVIFKNAEIRLI